MQYLAVNNDAQTSEILDKVCDNFCTKNRQLAQFHDTLIDYFFDIDEIENEPELDFVYELSKDFIHAAS